MMNSKNQHRVSISPKFSIHTYEVLYGAAAGAFAAVIYVGTLPPFARRTVFLQNLSRHLIFGVTLGETLRWLSKRLLNGAAR